MRAVIIIVAGLLLSLAAGQCNPVASCYIPGYFAATGEDLYVVNLGGTPSSCPVNLNTVRANTRPGSEYYLTGDGLSDLVAWESDLDVFPNGLNTLNTLFSQIHEHRAANFGAAFIDDSVSYLAQSQTELPVLVTSAFMRRNNGPGDATNVRNFALRVTSVDIDVLAYGGLYNIVPFFVTEFEGNRYGVAVIVQEEGETFPSVMGLGFPSSNLASGAGNGHFNDQADPFANYIVPVDQVVDFDCDTLSGPATSNVDLVSPPVDSAGWGDSKMTCFDTTCLYIGDGPEGGLGYWFANNCSSPGYKVYDMPGAKALVDLNAVSDISPPGALDETVLVANATHIALVQYDNSPLFVPGSVPSLAIEMALEQVSPGPDIEFIEYLPNGLIAVVRGSRVELWNPTPSPMTLNTTLVDDSSNWCNAPTGVSGCVVSSVALAALEMGQEDSPDLILGLSGTATAPLYIVSTTGRNNTNYHGLYTPKDGNLDVIHVATMGTVSRDPFSVPTVNVGQPTTAEHIFITYKTPAGLIQNRWMFLGIVRGLEDPSVLEPRNLAPVGDIGPIYQVGVNPISSEAQYSASTVIFRASGDATLVMLNNTYPLNTTELCCGNGLLDPGELCDDSAGQTTRSLYAPQDGGTGGVGTGSQPCNTTLYGCTAACGDGIVGGNEICDGSAEDSGDPDECLKDCTTGVCGNAIIETPVERCDPNNTSPLPGGAVCRDDCGYCGDQIRNGLEECDGVVLSDTVGNRCRTNCTNPVCGDGVLDNLVLTKEGTFEECDDGNFDETDGCYSNCTLKPAECGDLIVHPFDEECDEGLANSNDRTTNCTLSCLRPACGDGLYTNPDQSLGNGTTYLYSEECDPTAEDSPRRDKCSEDCLDLDPDEARIRGVAAGLAVFATFVSLAYCYVQKLERDHAKKRDEQFGFNLRLGEVALDQGSVLKAGISRRRLVTKPAPQS